jgi:hypothetical protein
MFFIFVMGLFFPDGVRTSVLYTFTTSIDEGLLGMMLPYGTIIWLLTRSVLLLLSLMFRFVVLCRIVDSTWISQ